MRNLEENTCSITGVGIRSARAAVIEIFENL
jgi:hypothetical protein